ncbi:MAG: hypothetical protein Q8O76_14100, partial [Chloroflexota bacterium]|nr:hypothetical protein [Chloroflexota bacterium]
PNMVSLFGDLTSSGTVPDSPLGPGWSTLAVRTSGTTTSVKLDLKTFLQSILPADMTPYVVSSTSWNTYLNTLQAVDMTYNAGADLWTYSFSLNAFFSVFPSYLQIGKTLQVISEGMRMGTKTITATAQPGPVTTDITLYVVDAQIPMKVGWNLISTPIALGSNAWNNIKALGGASASIDASLRWNPVDQAWVTVSGTDAMQPLEGIYLYSSAERPLGAILSRSSPTPGPQRQIRAGWNLVAPAPDLSLHSGIYKSTRAAGSYRGLTKATVVFTTLVSGSTYYYSLAVTPGQERDFTTTNSHLGTTFSTYPWGYVQDPWTFVPTLDSSDIATNPVSASSYYGWLVPFGGVWVYGESTRSLAGFSTTPISVSWLRTARSIVLGF